LKPFSYYPEHVRVTEHKPPMVLTKQEIRREALKVRSEIPKSEVGRLSASIFDHVTSLPEFKMASLVHTYVSSKENEVDTIDIIRFCFLHSKRVAVPVTDAEQKSLRHSEIFSLDDLKKGTFGISEPIHIVPVPLQTVNLVIVPVVAVDVHGTRIGFGRGYYDKFLNFVSCPIIALAFSCQVVATIPREPHDQKVGIVITENGAIRC
jgi:5-formyltetrahydrofolate cyclo-ligase